MEKKKIQKWKAAQGSPYPLGIHEEAEGVNFAIALPDASSCKLKIYEPGADEPFQVFHLGEETRRGGVFCITVVFDRFAPYEYLYEVKGKDLVDPYARRLTGREQFGSETDQPVRAVVEFGEFSWQDDKMPELDFSDLILYKLHVRGFTMHKNSKVKKKGTYLGIKEKLPYLKALGVNALLLMPCVEFYENRPEVFRTPPLADFKRNTIQQQTDQIAGPLRLNYWGYGAKSYYFAPKASYASEPAKACTELKELVRSLHQEGMELLLEMDFIEGTRQSLIIDCFRFWVREYHIDGFRFNADRVPLNLCGFDPYLSRTKLLTAGWDTDAIYGKAATPFFRNLGECNDHFMIAARRFLKGDEEQVGAFKECVRKNPECIGRVNYITDHNGFTLSDLYSYDVKHNEANNEEGRDGTVYNYSWNCGAEGTSRVKKVTVLRTKMIQNALCALFLSQGTPMLLSGDEFLNSQDGNNNAYCQDNEISWLDWNIRGKNGKLLEFTKSLIALRKKHRVLHNKIELKGLDYIYCGNPDISFHGTKAWYPDYSNYSRSLGIMLCGHYAALGRDQNDASFYIAFNMHWETHLFDLPKLQDKKRWELLLITDEEGAVLDEKEKQYLVPPRSIAVFIGG